MVDLSGTWRAAVAGDSQRDDYQDPEFDDGSWAMATVPGHWRAIRPSPPGRARGLPHHLRRPRPLRTRRREARATSRRPPQLAGARRRLLHQRRVARRHLPGRHGGLLLPPPVRGHRRAGRPAREHALAVEVACPRPSDLAAKRNLTGVFQHWDLLDQDWTPGGIWRPVHLEQSGPVRIRHWRVRCTDVTDQAATVAVRVVLDTTDAGHRRDRDHRDALRPDDPLLLRRRRRRPDVPRVGPGAVDGVRAPAHPVDRRGREPGGVDGQRAQPRALVAPGAGRPAALRRGGGGPHRGRRWPATTGRAGSACARWSCATG